jgi:hypothetical protein
MIPTNCKRRLSKPTVLTAENIENLLKMCETLEQARDLYTSLRLQGLHSEESFTLTELSRLEKMFYAGLTKNVDAKSYELKDIDSVSQRMIEIRDRRSGDVFDDVALVKLILSILPQGYGADCKQEHCTQEQDFEDLPY